MKNSQTETPPLPLSKARAAAGMTQKQLADASGLHLRTIGMIEQGRGFHASTARLLASALKMGKGGAKQLRAG